MRRFIVGEKIYHLDVAGHLIIKAIVNLDNQLSVDQFESQIKYLVCVDKNNKAIEINSKEAIKEEDFKNE